jgi:threonine/homoserine/homoserine lactone efflux protein
VIAAYLAAVAILALLTVLPGPDVAVVTRFALTTGRAAATRASFGVVIGLLLWGSLAVAGLAAVLAASATAYTVIKLAGAAYLVFMGLRVLWHSRARADEMQTSARVSNGKPLRAGLLTNVLNPKIAVFYTSVLPTLVPHGALPILWLSILVLTHVVLSLGVLTGYAIAFSRSRSVLHRPKFRQWSERVTGIVLIGFGLRVAAEAR